MDNSWIDKHRNSAEYKAGIYQFLRFAFRVVRTQRTVLCQCVNCANCLMKSYNEVNENLRCDGFLKGYKA